MFDHAPGIKPLSTIGFNFLSHGSQDLYPTYLTKSKGFSDHDATVATIIGNCVSCCQCFLRVNHPLMLRISGCYRVSTHSRMTHFSQRLILFLSSGGGIAGWVSQYIGRRLTIMYVISSFAASWITLTILLLVAFSCCLSEPSFLSGSCQAPSALFLRERSAFNLVYRVPGVW